MVEISPPHEVDVFLTSEFAGFDFLWSVSFKDWESGIFIPTYEEDLGLLLYVDENVSVVVIWCYLIEDKESLFVVVTHPIEIKVVR